jgi:hypothetical protein
VKRRDDLILKRSYLFLGLIVLFVFIQLIPVDRENPSSNSELELKAPYEIKTILKNSCFDCHSNQTNWPFYSYIAPISWLIARDVKRGRKNLNFSEWNSLSVEKRKKSREEIIEEISENEMPLPLYLITHSGAKLTDEQKLKLKHWAETISDQ